MSNHCGWRRQIAMPLFLKDTESGYTALHRSVYHGQIHVARYLLSPTASDSGSGPGGAGANAAITDHEGLTPIDLMVKDRYYEDICTNETSSSGF